MNKLFLMPFVVIVMISLLSVAYTPGGSVLAGQYKESESGATVEGTAVNASDVDVPQFSLNGLDMALVVLIAGLAIGGVAGFSLFGSGLSGLSQLMVFLSIVYLGLWAVFSLISWDLLQTMGIWGISIWTALTLIYVVGFAEEISGSSAVGD